MATTAMNRELAKSVQRTLSILTTLILLSACASRVKENTGKWTKSYELKELTGNDIDFEVSSDDKFLVIASNNHLIIRNPLDGSLRAKVETKHRKLSGLAISPDNKYIATCGDEGIVRLWKPKTGAMLSEFKAHDKSIERIVISPDSSFILTSFQDNTARIWDAKKGKLRHELKNEQNGVFNIKISPDSTYIVSTDGEKVAQVWDVKSGKLITKLVGHTHIIHSVDISPDSNFIVTGSHDQTARKWDSKTGRSLKTMDFGTWVFDALISHNGDFIVTTGDWTNIMIWDSKTGKTLHDIQDKQMQGLDLSYISSLQLYPNDQYFITYTDYLADARVWDIKNEKMVDTLKGGELPFNFVELSPKGQFIISKEMDANAWLWQRK